MKGDRVEVVVDTGSGTRTFDITATRAGRRVEVETARGVIEVFRGDPYRDRGPHRSFPGRPHRGRRGTPRRLI